MPVKSKAPRSSGSSAVVGNLSKVLSDTYVLAVKTHGYHWNVTGALFAPLHSFFGEQYSALLEAADDIAERIRALGSVPPSSMKAFLALTEIEEAGTKAQTAEAMLKDLLKSHKILRRRLVEAAEAADDADDDGTEDLMVERIRAHDKIIWMLESQV